MQPHLVCPEKQMGCIISSQMGGEVDIMYSLIKPVVYGLIYHYEFIRRYVSQLQFY